ncbi:sulfatase [Termitidicoccus mucosus]|uniref:sulfatase n=1 Tax=Termitidicoccus mucosus TaxID=1184151 RepID=UPI000838B3B2
MPRIRTLTALSAAATFLPAVQPHASPATAGPQNLNVLFIVSDDLKPVLGCYGDPVVRTPNIDRLAERGLVFQRAYAQQAVCSPSRTSLLTGRRPDTTKVYDLVTHFREAIPDVVTLPQYFKQHGYTTQSLGKIFHPGYDDPQSWTIQNTFKAAARYSPPAREILAKRLAENKPGAKIAGLPWESPDVPDNSLTDGSVATEAVKTLGSLAQARRQNDQPFFLAVGFLVPHLPFSAPKKYWDIYCPEDVRLPENYRRPTAGETPYSRTTWSELRKYAGIPATGPLTDEQARSMIHGYYACVSYLDAQIGRLLDALEQQGLAENTIVVLWGDHGWHLGDHGQWTKHTNFEQATHAPLIISAPGAKTAGQKTRALVEFVDVYPTLAELCGLPAPAGAEGKSLVPLIESPARKWAPAAFSQYLRSGGIMGYSIRTDRHRYTEWLGPNAETLARELYDHETDATEDYNIAGRAEHAALVQQLHAQLEAVLHISTIKRDPTLGTSKAKKKKAARSLPAID